MDHDERRERRFKWHGGRIEWIANSFAYCVNYLSHYGSQFDRCDRLGPGTHHCDCYGRCRRSDRCNQCESDLNRVWWQLNPDMDINQCGERDFERCDGCGQWVTNRFAHGENHVYLYRQEFSGRDWPGSGYCHSRFFKRSSDCRNHSEPNLHRVWK
jgi:hypothetical protein